MNNYKRAAAVYKRIIKRTRKKYWQDYCATLTADNTMDQIWKIFNSMRKKQPPDTFPLDSNGFLSASEKTEIFANHFFSVYNNAVLIDDIDRLHRHVIDAISYNHHAYNIPLKLSELSVVLCSLPIGKAAGLDDVPYEFLKHLDTQSEYFLLQIFNHCWNNSLFPDSWKSAIILPFRKPGKDPSLPVS